jgi:hypothetical protein
MNKSNIRIFLFACLIGWNNLMAQNVSDVPMNSFPFNVTGQSFKAYDNRYEGIKGTYTFLVEFRPGVVELKRGKFNNVQLNYDAYSDNLIAINDKVKDTVQLRKDMVVSFVLIGASGEEFAFRKLSILGTPTFLLSLVRDTISLYCRISKTYNKAELGGAYRIPDSRSDEFVTVNTYYVTKGSDHLQEIRKSKNGILEAFPGHEEQLSAYLKKNKIDFKDYNQMKLVVIYVNSLQNSQ